jgi:hypothetical protein
MSDIGRPEMEAALALLREAGSPPLAPTARARIRARLLSPKSRRLSVRVAGTALMFVISAAAVASIMGTPARIAIEERRPIPSPSVVEATPAPTDMEGAAALRAALAALREGRREEALRVSSEAVARSPNGPLASELVLVQMRALLALDRRKDALEFLEGLDLDALPRSTELRLLHAELLAVSGRRAQARALCDRLLALDLPPALVGRARALCRGTRP